MIEDKIKRVEIDPFIKEILDEKPNRMKVYSITMEGDGAVIECSLKTSGDSAILAKGNFISFDRGIVTTMVFARTEEQAVELAYKRWTRALKDSLLRYKNVHATMGYEEVFNDDNAPIPFLLKQWEQHMTPKGDKPCRSVREGLYLKENICGDMLGLAPEGKCYFDHQKDCNAWCTCWEGNEDDEEVKKIRATQDSIKNCGLPKYKVVEDWDADKIAEIKQEQLNVQTEKIVKEAIQKVILAGIELFIVGDLSDMNAIKEIEGCLKRLKTEEKGNDK